MGFTSAWPSWTILLRHAICSPAPEPHSLGYAGHDRAVCTGAGQRLKDGASRLQQIDFSAGGDGVVARGEIRSINDLRSVTGIRKKVVLAQNSPSHYLIMSLLIDAALIRGHRLPLGG